MPRPNIVRMGTALLRLVPPNNGGKIYGRDKVVFKVAPEMTKHEVKEYLQKVYSVPVRAVNTMNYDGKWKRAGYGRKFGRFLYKERDWKKAVVTLQDEADNPFLELIDERKKENQERREAAAAEGGGGAGRRSGGR
eukprot:g1606.t1